jgi:hypothetical protein
MSSFLPTDVMHLSPLTSAFEALSSGKTRSGTLLDTPPSLHFAQHCCSYTVPDSKCLPLLAPSCTQGSTKLLCSASQPPAAVPRAIPYHQLLLVVEDCCDPCQLLVLTRWALTARG